MYRPISLIFSSAFFLLLSILLAGCSSEVPGSDSLPRIAIAGLGIESSTFSPAVTEEEAFHARYGDEIFERYPFLSADSALRQRAEWVPAVVGKAILGGAVTREAYESLMNSSWPLATGEHCRRGRGLH